MSATELDQLEQKLDAFVTETDGLTYGSSSTSAADASSTASVGTTTNGSIDTSAALSPEKLTRLLATLEAYADQGAPDATPSASLAA